MIAILLVLHVLVAVVMVISILLQSGQAGGLSGAFGGGGGSQSLFGGRGAATFLTKATTYLGAAFMALSLMLAFAQSHRSGPGTEGRNIIRETLQPSSSPATAPAEQMPGEGGATGEAPMEGFTLPGAEEGAAPPAAEGGTTLPVPEQGATPAPGPGGDEPSEPEPTTGGGG